MKKIMKLMLALVLSVMYLIPSASAVSIYDTPTPKGEITINGAINGKNYSIYQILVLESYDTSVDGYIYKVTSDSWKDFITSNEIDGVYVNFNENNDTVTWIKAATKEENDAKVAEFAKKAFDHKEKVNKDAVTTNNITATSSKTAGNTGEVVFTDLALGYYLVDSSVGTICSLTTAVPGADINEKNSVPTIKKEVIENDTNILGSTNSAFIGEVITYKTTITVGEGAQNYKLYDKMDAGLTLGSTITVKLNGNVLNEKDGDVVNYEITKNQKIGQETYTFIIDFKKELNVNNIITVEYTATVNENAVTANNNTTKLEYGDNHFTESEYDTTTTYTYWFELVKTDKSDKKLEGAKFKLYDGDKDNQNAKEIKLVKESEGVYRVAYGDELTDIKKITEIEAGIAIIKGLDGNQTYYLEETRNPDGYTKLVGRRSVEITNANLDAEIEGDTYVTGGVQVINEVGSSLPETGGMGTVLFITVGSLMVTLFGVLLVTKFRMSKMDI